MVDVVFGDLPEEARFVRMIGCPQSRQLEVLELGQNLFVREVACEANPNPGSAVARLGMLLILNQAAASVLKANDGKSPC